jgi:malonyl CoA-acyl carrier protein transacylase
MAALPHLSDIVGDKKTGLFPFCSVEIMTSATQSTFLFPGQGAYQPGALAAAARECADVEELLRDIDSVAQPHVGTSVRELLLDANATSLTGLLEREPDTLQMAIYAAAVATYRLLQARDVHPSILVGHSFGEIAALVCAGAFSVREGAHIVALRSLALRPMAGLGYMAAITASAERCAAIVQMLDAPSLTIAVDNGPTQTVISGTTEAMDRLGIVAQALGLSFIRLASAYPFHNALLEPAAQAFQVALSAFRSQPLRVPVYSPILQRAYHDQDDLRAALSSHLTHPVRFANAIRRPNNIWAYTTPSFIEMGASNALVKLVRQILGDPRVAISAPVGPSLPNESRESMINAPRSTGLPSARHGAVVNIPFKESASAASDRTSSIASPTRRRLTREQVQRDIVALFAQAMEYPPEVFTDDVALEAELGIDSVKQMELLGKLEQEFLLPARPEDFRLSDYGTLRKITDFVLAATAASHASGAIAPAETLRSVVAAPTAEAVAAASTGSARLTHAALQQQIVALFAEAMEYPPEVFTQDVALEAELGIDSVKQMELLGKLEQRYNLPARPEDFRLADYGTLRQITDFVFDAIDSRVGEANFALTEAPEIATLPVQQHRAQVSKLPLSQHATLTRATLQGQIVALFAQAMEYPPEVFTDDVALEAELGIDSVKQMELLGKLEQQYRLPPRPEDFRLSDYGTLRKIADFVFAALDGATPSAPAREPAYVAV